MKSFKDYLIENIEEKKYSFKLKIAGDIPEHFEDTAKLALEKYKLTNFNKGKTAPIQAKLPDFPTLENQQVTVFDVELLYPTTSHVLTNYMAEQTGLDPCCIKIRSLKEEEEAELNVEHTDEKSGSLLSQDYQKENNQHLFGDKHISSFLKELAKENKGTHQTQYKGVNEKLLAKSAPKEKTTATDKVSAAKSPLSNVSNPKKGK